MANTLASLDLEPRPTRAIINLDALSSNFNAFRALAPKSKIMAVLKANAYGHGLVPCAKHFERIGADYMGVAFIEEGIELRRAGIKTPIIALGGISGRQIKHFIEFDIDITASSISKLEAIDAVAASMGKRARVHIKIDTGMERIGVHYYSAQPFLEKVLQIKHCEIVSVFSHFATGGWEDVSFAKTQLERFHQCTAQFKKNCPPGVLFHIANCGGLIQLPESALDMVRPGLMLYGVYPDDNLKAKVAVEPALTLRSQIVFVKTVKKGASVSYARLWTADSDTRIVTVPLGYGDGYPWRLKNKAQVLIRGKRYPAVGRICMDQLMINVGVDSAYNEDEVILIGKQGEERITVEELAELAETSRYEILTSINLRVPREYVGGSL